MAWYDINKTMSHNCLFNFVIGNRGCGKTYGAKKLAVTQHLKKGYEFIYLRRNDSELKIVKDSIFNDIILNNEFEGHEITFADDCYYVDGQICGYAMALSKAKDYKSVSYPKVQLIIFDEFLIEDNGYSRYLKNEVEQFLNFYMSIDRYRGVKVLFLANSVALINPYTLYFDLRLPYNSNFTRKGDILLQLVQDEEFINERKNTRFGKLIDGTSFSEYAIENKFRDNNENFIEKKTGKSTYYFTITYKDNEYGVWVDYSQGKYYISYDVDKSRPINYSLTQSDHSPNTLLIKRASKSPFLKNFIEGYKLGNVYFENIKLREICNDIIKMLLS